MFYVFCCCHSDLPEGFFDDPKMDAKVRHVEYKDPMTEEWERFQKSIAKETDVCAYGVWWDEIQWVGNGGPEGMGDLREWGT